MTTEKAAQKQPNNGEAGEINQGTGKAPPTIKKPIEATQDTSKPPKAGKTSHGNVRTEENKGEGIGEAVPAKDDPTAHVVDFDQV
jgi:hypothetical protein